MLEETTIWEIKSYLEKTGMKPRHIRNQLITTILNGELRQKTPESTTITPGTLTIEEFIHKTLKKYNKPLPKENPYWASGD